MSVQAIHSNPRTLDAMALTTKVRTMYTRVAETPKDNFHFELGRDLALRLGYSEKELDAIPMASVDSFAGVGYHFDYADIKRGDQVLDLGSGAGMDVFVAANSAGQIGRAIGVDMTIAQLQKASQLAVRHRYDNVWYVADRIENFDYLPHTVDVIISNGVINLSPDKAAVFQHMAANLRPGGRVAISDIVTELPLPNSITCNASLWAACIGGAMQREKYFRLMNEAGLRIEDWRYNDYQFVSNSAMGATEKYQVRSISLLAIKQ